MPEEAAQAPRYHRFLEHAGKRLTLAEWARRTGIGRTLIHNRIRYLNWSVAEALSIPPGVARKGTIA